MRVPTVTLFVESESGDWLIQSQAIDMTSRFTVATGTPRRISADDVKTVGFAAIVRALKDFGELCNPLPSSIDQLPQKQRDYFYRSHHMLNVAQPDSNRIEISLMRRKAGGFMGDQKRDVNPKATDFQVKLTEAIQELTRTSD